MKKNKGGRPTKYKPEYCKRLIAFFDIEKNKRVVKKEKNITKSNGTVESEIEYMLIAEDLPTFEKFARSIGVSYDTLISEWAKKYKEFSEAYNTAKQIQKEFLTDNGLKGLYPPSSFIFVAKNITDMKDKQDLDVMSGGEKLGVIILPQKNANTLETNNQTGGSTS